MKNAFTSRNVLCGGFILAALGIVQIAHAGYALPSPPPGFSGTPGAFTYKAANASEWLSGTVRTNATLNVAGRSVTVPAAMRVAANAPTFAARFMFANPLLLTAAGAAYLASQYIHWDESSATWVYSDPASNYPQSDGYKYFVNDALLVSTTIEGACSNFSAMSGWPIISCAFPDAWFQRPTGPFRYPITRQSNTSCPAGWYITPAGCVQNPPPVQVTQSEEEFIERVAPQIAPEKIPTYIPPHIVPIPVETPVINPTPQPIGVPYVAPQPRPLIVPLGDPQLVPNTDPQQWRQPMVRVSPSPTPSQPWRVNMQPYERITSSPQGIPEPVSEPDLASPAQPSQETDFCLRNPDVLACQKVPEFDIPEEEVPTDTTSITYEPESFMSGGSCPSAVYASVNGHQVLAWNWPQYCGYITNYAKPVLLSLCAFTALMIVAGGFRTE